MKGKNHIYEIASLLVKSIFEKLSIEDIQYLKKYSSDNNRLIDIPKELFIKKEISASIKNYDKYSYEKGYQDFIKRINTKKEKKNRILVFLNSSLCRYAAILTLSFLSLGTISYYYLNSNKEEVILPGKNIALLKTGQNSTIKVENTSISIDDKDVQINYDKGVLSYKSRNSVRPVSNNNSVNVNDEEHEFYVPRGGENTVVLSDGSVVYMNSDSKLTYPVKFEGSKRIVLLEGESYFKVKPDKSHPFIVRTKYGDIEVLGTSFNVNAYNKNGYCKTTLVNGKVNFVSPNNKSVSIKPNEQVTYHNGNISTSEVNVEDCVSWINGYYSFHNISLDEIMKSLERWYDVKVIFKDESLKNLSYTGRISRKESLNSFLKVFKLTGDLNYKIEDRVVTLTNNNQ